MAINFQSLTGNAQLRTSSHLFHLRKILRVPSMKSNLLSVQKFCRDNGTSFYFDATSFSDPRSSYGEAPLQGFQ
jgi:hypothetical protein